MSIPSHDKILSILRGRYERAHTVWYKQKDTLFPSHVYKENNWMWRCKAKTYPRGAEARVKCKSIFGNWFQYSMSNFGNVWYSDSFREDISIGNITDISSVYTFSENLGNSE